MGVVHRFWPEHLGRPVDAVLLGSFVSVAVARVRMPAREGEPGGREYVLKVCRQDCPTHSQEVTLMTCWSAAGLAPKVVWANSRVIILDWAQPDGPATVDQVAKVLAGAHAAPIPDCLPTLAGLLRSRFGDLCYTSAALELLTPAEVRTGADADRLSAEAHQGLRLLRAKPVGLHADLHLGNVLARGTRTLLIDPLGARGDAGYDLAHLAVCSGADGVTHTLLGGARRSYIAAGGSLCEESLTPWLNWCAAFRWRIAVRHTPDQAARLAGIVRECSLR